MAVRRSLIPIGLFVLTLFMLWMAAGAPFDAGG
jgi:hypothetical protein